MVEWPERGQKAPNYWDTQLKAYIDDPERFSGDFAGLAATKNVFTGKQEINGGFVNSYDTDYWIAGPVRENPVNNSQGLYIQHRVKGDLGGLVHDAGASELRFNGVSNTGTGQSAHENSLVVTGGVNDINLLVGSLANFHTSGTPTGHINQIWLLAATQAPALPAGLTVDKAISLFVQPQTIGTENYSIHAADGKSVLGVIVPKDKDTTGLRIQGLTGQTANLLQFLNAGGSSLLTVSPAGVLSVGGAVSNSQASVNNNLTNGTIVALKLKASSAQSVNIFQAQLSNDAVKVRVDAAGNLASVGATIQARNAADSGTFVSLGVTGFRWNDAGLERTTVGAAGAASALPATPTKYLVIRDSADNQLLIPAYAYA